MRGRAALATQIVAKRTAAIQHPLTPRAMVHLHRGQSLTPTAIPRSCPPSSCTRATRWRADGRAIPISTCTRGCSGAAASSWLRWRRAPKSCACARRGCGTFRVGLKDGADLADTTPCPFDTVGTTCIECRGYEGGARAIFVAACGASERHPNDCDAERNAADADQQNALLSARKPRRSRAERRPVLTARHWTSLNPHFADRPGLTSTWDRARW
jgi:hypothetical protein